MKFSDRIGRSMAHIYLRYVSVAFCLAAHVSLAFKPPRRDPGKRLLVLKPDAIGDYLLVRNFLALLRNSGKYRDHEIVFCGNAACREFILHFDGGCADNFIWIDKERIYLNPFYYIRLARSLYRQYGEVIHPVRSRELIFDYLAKVAGTEHRIAPEGDTVNILRGYRRISDRWYTKLIPAGDLYTFEFEANGIFFGHLLGISIPFTKPFLEANRDESTLSRELPDRYAVISPGAQLPFRRWSPPNFAAVCRYLWERYGLAAVVVGGKGDMPLAAEIARLAGDRVTDLTGRTRLDQLPGILAGAKLLVSNDTMAVHLAAALNLPAVVVSQMNHYGRFVPYPGETGARMKCIIPGAYREVPERELTLRFRYGSGVDINLVTVDQINGAIDALLEIS